MILGLFSEHIENGLPPIDKLELMYSAGLDNNILKINDIVSKLPDNDVYDFLAITIIGLLNSSSEDILENFKKLLNPSYIPILAVDIVSNNRIDVLEYLNSINLIKEIEINSTLIYFIRNIDINMDFSKNFFLSFSKKDSKIKYLCLKFLLKNLQNNLDKRKIVKEIIENPECPKELLDLVFESINCNYEKILLRASRESNRPDRPNIQLMDYLIDNNKGYFDRRILDLCLINLEKATDDVSVLSIVKKIINLGSNYSILGTKLRRALDKELKEFVDKRIALGRYGIKELDETTNNLILSYIDPRPNKYRDYYRAL
jgi:hypothetical protein